MKLLEKFNTKMTCPKCGYDPAKVPLTFWKLTYKQRACYSTSGCTWEDQDVDEHFHVECPMCGCETFVMPCSDYQKAKEDATKEKWSTGEKPKNGVVSQAGVRTFTNASGVTTTEYPDGRKTYTYPTVAKQAAANLSNTSGKGWSSVHGNVSIPPVKKEVGCPGCPVTKAKAEAAAKEAEAQAAAPVETTEVAPVVEGVAV